jgi:cyclophilin family peptidyl-prolyl cis-trans isomerase
VIGGVNAAWALVLPLAAVVASGWQVSPHRDLLRTPDHHELSRQGPDAYDVLLDTSRGPIRIGVRRDWSPRGADRFYNLVRLGFYDGARFFRVIAGQWAQFGINGDPDIARIWRHRTIPDEPRVQSNVRGTIAYAFRDPNGRTTQVFINLRDNSATHDKEPFVPFGQVVQGMEVADALYSGYGEKSGGGIRAGRQDPVFAEGNAYLLREFPLLDYIRTAKVVVP